MTEWGKICRICAGPAEFSIFKHMPYYLHSRPDEIIEWLDPISGMLEEITGMKVSSDDDLPKNICVLCISYLKHAITFREQAINTCLSFLAVKAYKRIINDKEVLNDDEIKNGIKQQHFDDENLLKNYQKKNQSKVKKQLIYIANNNLPSDISKKTQLCLQYLSKLYDNNLQTAAVQGATIPSSSNKVTGNEEYNEFECNDKSFATKSTKQFNKTNEMMNMMPSCTRSGGIAGGKRQNLEDGLPRNTSSDEYDEPEEDGAAGGHVRNNIFSYKEKNFQEDDIMDLDELKGAITINMPFTCKEHKCTFCFKRFMFEESFEEHTETCIEYRFSKFLEEMNKLLHIRQAKEISPHEFIRRMIFSLRKTCEWLKENCIDTTLPDLLQYNQKSKESSKQKQESECKSKASSTEETQNSANKKINKTLISSTPKMEKRPIVVCNTPINMSNNILHEIERSESRNSHKFLLKKPIPILATSSTINNLSSSMSKPLSENTERLTFMEKLQNASKPLTAKTPTKENLLISKNPPTTPLITVRQDLLAAITPNTLQTSPLKDLLQSTSSQTSNTPVINVACARCPQCKLFFDTLDALEIHNAIQHNSLPTMPSGTPRTMNTQADLDEEHKRIIALFEDEDQI